MNEKAVLYHCGVSDREQIGALLTAAGYRNEWRETPSFNDPEYIRQLIQQDRLATLGTLIDGIAHELNNPAHLIRLNIEFLQMACESLRPVLKQILPAEGVSVIAGMNQADAAEHIQKSIDGILIGATRISSLIDELKAYAYPDPVEQKEPVEIRMVIRSASLLIAHVINRCAGNFKVRVAPDTPYIQGHFRHLEQVIINLLHNACLAVEKKRGSITVDVEYAAAAHSVSIRIRDDGVGIPPEDMDHVMDPFFTTRRELGSVGLGLAICNSIVREHRGSLTLESTPGEGTTVAVVLPALETGESSL